MADYSVVLTRKDHREYLVIRGDIESWLELSGARATKTLGRYVVRGWRCEVSEISPATMEAMDRIFPGRGYEQIPRTGT